ncbi:MAG TPA: shikimate dehydrogenase [Phycisphaerales bacterium]|nr:shikimate dehydrogenase [Phycisphaerales bacterium]
MQTKLTVPIAAQNLDQAKQQTEAAIAAGAEMLELRTDYLENLSVELVKKLITKAKKSNLPIIVTCRDRRQGGAIDYSEQLRVDVLVAALKAGAEFIDFEYENFLSTENQEKTKLALSQCSKGRLILSAHNFKTKFDNISRLHRHILTVYPAAIPKLVYTANHINDCFEAFDLLHNTSGERIVFCMGEAGLVSRIIAKKLGSFVTFASIDEKTATASGQLTIEQLKNLYRYDCINADTKLYGIIGSPVGHSAGPAVHNACFAEIKANKLYLPLLVEGGQDEFDLFMDCILVRGWLNFHGFSVTIPHKANALEYTKAKFGFVEPLAERIGAVNTMLIGADGKLSAYNTDYAGALDAITSTLEISCADLKDLSVAVIGAGGVARAIVAGLSDAGAKICIYNRTVKKGEKLAAEFGCEFRPLSKLPSIKAKLLINCTSIGMKKTEVRSQKSEEQRLKTSHETPLPKECIKKDMVVFDTVYNPAETLLLKQAKEAGTKTINGVDMFINQAMAQFKLFTGQTADPELMRKTIRNCPI